MKRQILYHFLSYFRNRMSFVQNNLLRTLLLCFSCLICEYSKLNAQCSCNRQRDSLALKKFYEATDGANSWVKKWDFTKPMSQWFGVDTSPEGCVIGLDLDGNYNKGWSSGFGGNGLNGSLPVEFGNLCKLQYLILRENPKLGGILPNIFNNFSELILIWVGSCSFKGPFPSSFWQMGKMSSIEFNDNKLSMTIPKEIGNLRQLRAINFEKCDLQGTLPSEIGNLTRLQCLYLSLNPNLSGKIPISFQNLIDLRIFNLNYSAFDSLPNLSNLPFAPNVDCGDGFFACENHFTFDDILPNWSVKQKAQLEFCTQINVFKDTTITLEEGGNLTLNLGFDGSLTTNTYEWRRNDTTIAALTSRQNRLILRGIKPEQAGVYVCDVTNDNVPNTFLRTGKIRINVKAKPTQTVTPDKPLGISPNGDGMNDFLIFDEITTGNFPKNELVIKNRWGQTVFKKTKYENDWSGQSVKGEDLPPGTYYYILRLDINDGNIKTGDILLVR
ncbi:MAG: gliding motility-associated C-terminal domain-containing protein [Saprospiraceae bacterium]|nr:gliding motility-associated C-terminal domain-containing protein [Saprospiraceae bacterium]